MRQVWERCNNGLRATMKYSIRQTLYVDNYPFHSMNRHCQTLHDVEKCKADDIAPLFRPCDQLMQGRVA